MKIAIAQINCITADLEGNTNQIINAIKTAIQEKVEILVFPETAITGYCCGALFDQQHFIEDQLTKLGEIINAVPANLVVIIGYVKLIERRRNHECIR